MFIDKQTIQHYTLILLCSLLLQTNAHADRMLREMQEIEVTDSHYTISVPNDPAWLWQIEQINNRPTFIAQTPELFYPPIAMTITSYNKMKVNDQSQLKIIAGSALEIAAKNYQSTDFDSTRVKPATYSNLSGYEAHFTGSAHGESVAVRAFIAMSSQHNLLSLQAYTTKQTQSAMQLPVDTIWNSIQFQNKPTNQVTP